MDYKMNCRCGRRAASFNFKDEIMPVEVINGLYCPECSSDISFNQENMLSDNGWIISYDMEIAGFMASQVPVKNISPESIFDEGYCTWRGMTPTDHIDSVREREELVKLAKIDPRRYLSEIKDWAVKRMERLSAEGWRKANEREAITA
jgi:hypothetical protein